MKTPYMAAHLRAPVGLWAVICDGRIVLHRDGAKVVFEHLHERRADALPRGLAEAVPAVAIKRRQPATLAEIAQDARYQTFRAMVMGPSRGHEGDVDNGR
jgi:hypothetical protein